MADIPKDYPMNRLRRFLFGAWRSWTVRFNISVSLLIAALPDIQANLPSAAQYIPSDIYKLLSLAVLLANILLRAKTSKALGER